MELKIFPACEERVDIIKTRYDEFTAACDDYVTLLQSLVDAERAKAKPDERLIGALNRQANAAKELIEVMETEALDKLIRFADRLVIVKLVEEGNFV